MRDRLIELLENTPTDFEGNRNVAVIADYLLENGVIVPPYKLGTKVYVPIESLSLPIPYTVYECEIQRYILTTDGLIPLIKVKKGSVTYGDIQTSLDNLYATKEEAEQALKGGEQE